MFGKLYSSAFNGSMAGQPPTVWALWGYIIAHAKNSTVEFNPKLVAVILGTTEQDVMDAVAVLEAPDPRSRSDAEDGRRITRDGQFQWRVVNHEQYRSMRNEDDRRDYNRRKQREYRARKLDAETGKTEE